jgi:outer membrane protein assembly factor BamB
MRVRLLFTCACALVLTSLAVTAASVKPAADWPQWRGPERTGISRETGLLKAWPAAGPSTSWTISTLGQGYGSLAVVGDRLYVQGSSDTASLVFCLNRADGRTIWRAALGPKGNEGRGNGPRGTPTVDGDRVYALTENGDLACLRARDGSPVWRRNILKEFGGRNLTWLISESPLVDGNRLIVSPGGPGAGIVALDKMSGQTVWQTKDLSDAAGYASTQVADVGGVRTIFGFTSRAAVGVRASDGKLMWSYTPVANRTANITTPVVSGDRVFYTSAYGTGCALLQLKPGGGEVKAEEVYFSKEMQNHHGGVVLVNGYIYGFSNNILTCLEMGSGKVMWRDRSVGKGSVAYADGNLYLLGENNVVGLAEATPQGYREKGRFSISDQGFPSWAHPVISNGRLYIRNQGTLAVYDVRGDLDARTR